MVGAVILAAGQGSRMGGDAPRDVPQRADDASQPDGVEWSRGRRRLELLRKHLRRSLTCRDRGGPRVELLQPQLHRSSIYGAQSLEDAGRYRPEVVIGERASDRR